MQETTYSVSDSVSCAGLGDDLNNGPRAAISGTLASCSELKKNNKCECEHNWQDIWDIYIFIHKLKIQL